MMRGIQLGKAEYYDKVFACWLGKNIGGTLGAPFEGRKYVNNLQFYEPIPNLSAPNDDLDIQLVWLKMLEDKGIEPTLPDFAEYWRQYLSAYPWNEYGFCLKNLERGLMPPVSGCFQNYFVDEMGSPIRSEIWACMAAGDPQSAAAMAWKDSVLDHAGGEGTYGEMFWAAVESAAFVLNDPKTLIRIGLAMIPLPCAISRVVREALWCRENSLSWAEARERIATLYGHHHPWNAIPNHGFIILGWLYGKDFGDKLCKAVNCGYDTDCTGATLGAILGIIGGTSSIPDRWRKPIGENINLSKYTNNCNAPKTIEELSERTQALAEQFVSKKSATVIFAEKTFIPEDALSILYHNEKARAVLRRDIQAAVAVDGDMEVTFHYNGDPVLQPGISRSFEISLRKKDVPVEAYIELNLPEGWTALVPPDEGSHHRFDVLAPQVVGRNTITVEVKLPGRIYRVNFSVLGPDEADGFLRGANIGKWCAECGSKISEGMPGIPRTIMNVPRCIKCGARKGSCLCNEQ